MKSELKKLAYLTSRNVKLYFKDKMTFFVSLITPIILLVLFITFLKSTYENNIVSNIGNFTLDKKVIDAFTGGWLFSSVLSVSCITVSFCSGIMVLDKLNGASIDFLVTPVKKNTIKFGYVISNLVSTITVCLLLLVIGLVYLAIVGFYLSIIDIILIILNIVLTSLFGTILSNIIWSFTSSQGVVSGVCTLVSALYGFICGAYMPISTMGNAMQTFTKFLPGTYSTVIFRKCFLNGVVDKMNETLPIEMTNGIVDAFDYNFSLFESNLSLLQLFAVLFCSVIIMFLILTLTNILSNKKHKSKVK